MTKELELKLVEKYPKILKDYGGDEKITCMAWGFECEDGWFEILDKAMEEIQYFCDLCSSKEKEITLVAEQIKQKFGTLRFYYRIENASDVQKRILDLIVDNVERKSARVCEVSGDRGKLCMRGHWVKTLSEKERENRNYQRMEEV